MKDHAPPLELGSETGRNCQNGTYGTEATARSDAHALMRRVCAYKTKSAARAAARSTVHAHQRASRLPTRRAA